MAALLAITVSIGFTGCESEPDDTPPPPKTKPVFSVQPTGANYEKDAASVTDLTVTAAAEDGGTISYEWFKVGTPDTSVATTQAYTPPVNDVGSAQYYAVATNDDAAQNVADKDKTAKSNTVTITVSFPALTGTLSIDKTSPKVGDVLTASLTGGTGSGTATYIWYAGSGVVQESSQATYTVLATDEGKAIKVSVSYSGNSGSKESAPTAAVAPAPVVTDPTYVITGNSGSFSATKDGSPLASATGGIQAVIDAIRTDANGDDCIVQFGDGTVLDIGNVSAIFSDTWGTITINGKIVSSIAALTGTVSIGDMTNAAAISVIINADIENTATVAGTPAVGNHGKAVSANTTTLKITGGTIKANAGNALFLGGSTEATIEGTNNNPLITSANIQGGGGSGTPPQTPGTTLQIDTSTLTIKGGTVTNSVDNSASRTVATMGTGNLNIQGGTITATGSGGRVLYLSVNTSILHLSGNPTISGGANQIYFSATPTGGLIIDADPEFTPGTQLFSIAFGGTVPANGNTIVTNGKAPIDFSDNFTFASASHSKGTSSDGNSITIVR